MLHFRFLELNGIEHICILLHFLCFFLSFLYLLKATVWLDNSFSFSTEENGKWSWIYKFHFPFSRTSKIALRNFRSLTLKLLFINHEVYRSSHWRERAVLKHTWKSLFFFHFGGENDHFPQFIFQNSFSLRWKWKMKLNFFRLPGQPSPRMIPYATR